MNWGEEFPINQNTMSSGLIKRLAGLSKEMGSKKFEKKKTCLIKENQITNLNLSKSHILTKVRIKDHQKIMMHFLRTTRDRFRKFVSIAFRPVRFASQNQLEMKGVAQQGNSSTTTN